MNLVFLDLENLIYLYLPYDQIQDRSDQFWLHKALFETRLDLDPFFNSIPGTGTRKYLHCLATHGIAVRGTEEFVEPSEMVRYAVKIGDKELARYAINLSDSKMMIDYFWNFLEETNWIDLLFNLAQKPCIVSLHNWAAIAYHNGIDKARELAEMIGQIPNYEIALKSEYQVIKGLLPIEFHFTDANKLPSLAIRYGHESLVPKLRGLEWNHIYSEDLIEGWIYRRDKDKVLSLINNIDFRDSLIGDTLGKRII